MPSPPESIFRGIALSVAMRWIDRAIGLTSTLILARILSPDDFGIIAMASIAIGLADVVLDLGVNVALIQNKKADQSHFDTAWTLRLIQTTLSTAILIALAPYITSYFGDSRIEPVLSALALTLLLSGMENIGIIALQKNMQFGAEFRFLFIRRITGFCITIFFAFSLRSYWALVIGALSGKFVGVILSYILHPMRPRLSLVRFKEIFHVSQWMLLRGISIFLQNNLHRILVGRWSNSSTMGAYTLADEISAMPTGELLAPLNRVLFPAFSNAKDDKHELKRLYLLAQGIQSIIGIPAGLGLMLVAPEIVTVLLGEKWISAIPFIEVLAIMNVFQALSTSSGYVIISLGKFRIATYATLVQLAVFSVMAGTIFLEASAHDIATLRLTVAALGIGLGFSILLITFPAISLKEIIFNTYRPTLAALAMVALVFNMDITETLHPVSALAAKVIAGALIYIVTLLFAWRLHGKPDGAERYLLDKMKSLSQKERKA